MMIKTNSKKELKKNEVDRTQSRNENRGRSMRLRKKLFHHLPSFAKLFIIDTKDMRKKQNITKRTGKGAEMVVSMMNEF